MPYAKNRRAFGEFPTGSFSMCNHISGSEHISTYYDTVKPGL